MDMYPKGMISKMGLKMQMLMYLTFSMITLSNAQPCNNVTFRNLTPGLDQVSIDWFITHPAGTTYEIELTRISPSPAGDPVVFQATSRPFIIGDLMSGTEYSIRIRALCPSNNSSWSSPFRFTTFILNSDNCDLDLDIQLNNCNSNRQIFNILVDDVIGNLGVNIELVSLNLLIEHNRPDDLDIRLISPSGEEVLIIRNYGLLQNDFGDIESENCSRPIIFSTLSCTFLDAQGVPLRDSVRPFESFEKFHDGESAQGIWKLSICDRHNDDRGKLISAKLNFSSELCTPPRKTGILDVNGTSAVISVESSINCQSTIVELVPAGNLPGTSDSVGNENNILVEVDCSQEFAIVENLNSFTQYTIFTRTKCADDAYSQNTCGITFSTLCTEPSIKSDFDDLTTCIENCEVYCVLDPVWYNDTEQELQWIVNKGSTPTVNTGPEFDFYGLGSYIYIASSNPSCVSSSPANLLSECLEIGSLGDGCSMQFSYHQFGNQIGQLILEITDNAGSNWDTLFLSEGNLGESWRIANLNLQPYANKTVQFRFSGLPQGPRGNMALDEIIFFGDISVSDKEFIYYTDLDNDGFGTPTDSIIVCFNTPPEGFASNNVDCDDSNSNINPNASEIPCNLIDDNCNGLLDEALSDLQIVSSEVFASTCKGQENGRIAIDVEGGTGPYEITWSTGDSGSVVENLPDGLYQATISDAANCLILTDTFVVESPQNILLSILEIQESTCDGISDGVIHLTSNGGEEPVIYNWSDGGMGENRQDLLAGFYSVTLTDAQGCQLITENLSVTAGQSIELSLLELRQPRCYDVNDGQIRVLAEGDPTQFTYLWSTNETGPTARFLGAGVYEVSVTNTENLCSVTQSYELIAPDSLDVEIIALDPVSCPGGNTGRIIISPSGGDPDYTYFWSKPGFQSFNRNLNEITAGAYTLVLSDSKNCNTTFGPFIVNEPDEFILENVTVTPNQCLLGNQGTIDVEISGGTPNYQYFWSNGSLSDSQDSLFNGFYILTITDELACRKIFPAIEISSTNLPLETDVIHLKNNQCYGDRNGQIAIEINEGISPYEYHWSTGRKITKVQSKDTINNLLTGAYSLTITDAEGCNAIIDNITVDGPEAPLSHSLVEIETIRCHGETNGRIHVQANGGIPPYEFLWNNGDQGNQVDSLSAGVYSFILTDQNSCVYNSPLFNMTQPPPLKILANIFDEDACADGLSRINITADGGEAPYDINWYINGDTINTFSLIDIECGLYAMSLMDFRGCSLDTSLLIGTVGLSSGNIEKTQIKLFPNPFTESFYLDIDKTLHKQDIQIEIFNTLGIKLYSQQVVKLPALILPGFSLSKGTYLVRLTIQDQTITKTIQHH